MENNFQTKGNKGEWSELYALAYLLVNGGAHSADENQAPIPDEYFKVLQVVISNRDLQDELKYEVKEETIEIFENENHVKSVEKELLKEQIDFFFQELTSGKGKKTFAVKSGTKLMHSLNKKTISAGSGERETDLSLVIIDNESGAATPRFGFSVKSQIGQAATLLNSSGATNLIYKVVPKDGFNLNELPDISKTASSHPQNVRRILDSGFELHFDSYQNEKFADNLSYVDSQLPSHFARVLLESYIHDELKSFSEICERVFPIEDKKSSQPLFKLKELLGAISMGLRPAREWKGNASKFKGLMVVKLDGSLVFYFMNSRLKFEEYLYSNVKFERPSTKKFKYGSLYEKDGSMFIKLNAQIRFKK
jgi:type II restriction enzyme